MSEEDPVRDRDTMWDRLCGQSHSQDGEGRICIRPKDHQPLRDMPGLKVLLDQPWREAAVPVLMRWGIRSHHGEWSDAEAQADAATDLLDALIPVIKEAMLTLVESRAYNGADDQGQRFYDWGLNPWLAQALRGVL